MKAIQEYACHFLVNVVKDVGIRNRLYYRKNRDNDHEEAPLLYR